VLKNEQPRTTITERDARNVDLILAQLQQRKLRLAFHRTGQHTAHEVALQGEENDHRQQHG
jgi:hypothetical protein